ncbi:unnamed protein product [Clavelina lepadiformis]|uniref:Kinetochore protein Nuf2 N-terminal domain-containing protein n=1 Tax=Clavelina lepadiformis TaxID=159417 RepID=A0ABP0H3G3_CLALP
MMSEYEAQMTFEAPQLEEDDIQQSIHMGLLGDKIRHVTIEQLKNVSPALMMQICTSVLQMLDVETDNLGQQFLQASLERSDDKRPSTLLYIHIPHIMNKLIPGCDQMRCALSVNDLLYPKWKKLRKFLSVTINYMRSWESNLLTWNELISKYEDMHAQKEEIIHQNTKLQNAIKEVDAHLLSHGPSYQAQRERLVEVEKEFQELLIQKDNKQKENNERKQSLSNEKEILSSLVETHVKLRNEIEAKKGEIVSSPNRELAERDELIKKLNTMKEDCANVKDATRASEWKIETLGQTLNHIQHADHQLSEAMAMREKILQLQNDQVQQQFEIESQTFSNQRLKQEIVSLKQQITDQREKFHRENIRRQKQLATSRQKLEDIEKLKTILFSQHKDRGGKIKSFLSAIEEQEMILKRLEVEHEQTMDACLQMDKEMREWMVQVHNHVMKSMENKMSSKKIDALANSHDSQSNVDK